MTSPPTPDEPAGTAGGSRPGFENKGWADHRKVRLSVVVIALIGGMVTILHTLWGVGAAGPNASGATVTLGSSSIAAAHVGSSISNRTTAAARPPTAISVLPTSAVSSRSISTPANQATTIVPVGACLNASHTPVPCTAPHVAEVVAEPGHPCNDTVLDHYLGGDPSVDVIRVSATSLTIGGPTFCVVASDGPFMLAPLVNGLAGGNAAYLRRCLDTRLARTVVPCSAPHTAEYVGVTDGSAPDRGQCATAAATYIDTNLDSISDQVTVSAIVSTDLDIDHPRCLVQVLGGNLLYDSVRNLGTNALPITPH